MLLPWDFGKLDRWVLLRIGDHRHYRVFTRSFELFRLPDLFRALVAVTKPLSFDRLDSWYQADLTHLLSHHRNVPIAAPQKQQVTVDYGRDDYIPTDSFWFIRGKEGDELTSNLLIRLRRTHLDVQLEVAARAEDVGQEFIKRLVTWSIDNSIYRGKVLRVPDRPDTPDDFGNMPVPAAVMIEFARLKSISADQIIMSEPHRHVVQRNVLDFFQHRHLLRRAGIPSKRAMLFHGPPGTGKTYTSQYIASELKGITTFLATGQALSKVESVCQLARLLQPSLVILEDIDLVFTAREINLYSTALGDFLDQLDGFKGDDEVIFLLTTNAIERLEKALKDRPGRINQCVYFGPPTDDLRRKYLNLHLQSLAAEDVDVRQVVRMTRGSSQAFLKELVQRATLINLEREGFAHANPQLSTADFSEAHAELTGGVGREAETIVGFRVPDADELAETPGKIALEKSEPT
jgi:SpoVK/Ycf46/Vps4 family AAA+-type ATPase